VKADIMQKGGEEELRQKYFTFMSLAKNNASKRICLCYDWLNAFGLASLIALNNNTNVTIMSV